MTSPEIPAENTPEAIAVIGMSVRYPGASDAETFWRNLRDGVESISFFERDELHAHGIDRALIDDPRYVRARGVIDNVDMFDAAFFGYGRREAEVTDPQQRVYLECAWQAVEDAGHDPERFDGRIASFAGVGMNTYVFNTFANEEVRRTVSPYQLMIANDKDFLSTRISYKMNLRGPSMTVQCGCSTSLAAVHLAMQSLLSGESDMALAGGVSIRIPQNGGYLYQESGIFSPDGHCRAFDEHARGTVSSSGAGVVVLRRLSDAVAAGDRIRAVLLGSAINNDGNAKAGFTAPSVEGQTAVISEALAMAGVDADSISYVEAHGTGTILGDPIEISALTKAFRRGTARRNFCAIGSVKTNIGHTDAASGVAGLIKTALALDHAELPPSLHYTAPNPRIDFDSTPFFVNAARTPWAAGNGKRRAGVSSFGIGGTNVHVVLEEAPARQATSPSRPRSIFPLSARSAAALDAMRANLAPHIEGAELADVAFTLATGRKQFAHREFLVSGGALDAGGASLRGEASEHHRPVTFLFPGQGAQYAGMMRELYEHEPTVRETVDRAAAILTPHLGLDLRRVLFNGMEDLSRTWLTQPALFVVEYALARLWMEWGLVPEAMLGHSVGEYVAACLAGVLTLEDALALVAARGLLIQQLRPGAMAAVPLAENELQLGDALSLAAVNAPRSCVVSGPEDAVAAFERTVPAARRLQTSHAFHSAQMDLVAGAFRDLLQKVTFSAPAIPYLSNVTGTWITAAEATDPEYYVRHLRGTVRFSDAVAVLVNEPARVFIECGPGRTLTSFVRAQAPEATCVASLPHPREKAGDYDVILDALGRLWIAGATVDWSGFYTHERRQRVSLPTYPFERQRYWVEAGRNVEHTIVRDQLQASAPAAPETIGIARKEEQRLPLTPTQQTIAGIWRALLGSEVAVGENLLAAGATSLLAVQAIERISTAFGVSLPASAIYELTSVAAQAAHIDRELDARSKFVVVDEETPQLDSPLVPIQPNGTRRPLFCVHPAGGIILCYAELANHLGDDQPLYGLQSPAVYGGAEPEEIEARAAQFVEAIREVQPEGPYQLSGLSYGGNVAFEMARQLRAGGEQVSLLALFDSHPPVSYDGGTPDPMRFRSGFIRMIRTYGFSPFLTVSEDDVLSPMAEHFFHLWHSHHLSLRRYRPKKIYPDRITFFRAQAKIAGDLAALLDIHLEEGIEREWGRHSSEPLEIIDVPGDHLTMVSEPHVSVLADKLRALLDRVEVLV